MMIFINSFSVGDRLWSEFSQMKKPRMEQHKAQLPHQKWFQHISLVASCSKVMSKNSFPPFNKNFLLKKTSFNFLVIKCHTQISPWQLDQTNKPIIFTVALCDTFVCRFFTLKVSENKPNPHLSLISIIWFIFMSPNLSKLSIFSSQTSQRWGKYLEIKDHPKFRPTLKFKTRLRKQHIDHVINVYRKIYIEQKIFDFGFFVHFPPQHTFRY